MQVPKKNQNTPSILQLKSILARLKNDINMNAITIAIRQHCLQQQQTHLKNSFLNFFLICEGKLKRYGNAEWNRVINNQIKKIVGFQKVEALMRRKMVGCGLAMIQRLSFLDEQSKVQQKLYDQFSDLRDMQISDDVKIKTKYFFNWCKFIDQRKVIKMMKNKEIEDLKKSKVFHQYSLKFQTFIQWKHYIKKIKTTRQRALLLEDKTRKNQLAQVFKKINEKTQVITIEKLLQEAVMLKMEKVRNKKVFQKLRKATEGTVLQKVNLRRKSNIWLYRLFDFLGKKGNPLMNLSSKRMRRDIAEEYKTMCLRTSMKGLKSLMLQTISKVRQISKLNKRHNLKKFIEIKRYLKNSGTLKRQIKLYLKKSFFSSVMKSIVVRSSFQSSFNKKRKALIDQISKERLKKGIQKWTLFNNAKRQVNKKVNIFEETLELLQIRKLYDRLTALKSNRQTLQINQCRIGCSFAFNFFRKNINLFRAWRSEKLAMNSKMDSHHNNILIKKSIRGLRMVKDMKTGEAETLNSVVRMLTKKIKINTIEILQDRYFQTMKLQKLIKKSEFIVLKLSFVTILNRMLSKKMKMKNFAIKQDQKLKRKLFNMLLTHKQLMLENRLKATEIFKDIVKRQCLSKLKKIKEEKDRCGEAHQKLSFLMKGLLFKTMKKHQINRSEIEQKSQQAEVLIKYFKFGQFVVSGYNFVQERRQEERKKQKIQKNSIRYRLKQMKEWNKRQKQAILKRKQQKSYLDYLISDIQSRKVQKALKQMTCFSLKYLEKRQQLVYYLKFQQVIKYLAFNQSYRVIKKEVRHARAQEIFNALKQNFKLSRKVQRLKKIVKSKYLFNTLSTIKQNIALQQQQEDSKVNSLSCNLKDRRQKKAKQIFVSRIKNDCELKQSIHILINHRIKQNCQFLVKIYLRQKSNKLKEFIALRHYAANVKRKGMRALKKGVNLYLLKQNKNQVENTSKILVERSIDNVRRKSKLIQTIERYNMSRVSRVIR